MNEMFSGTQSFRRISILIALLFACAPCALAQNAPSPLARETADQIAKLRSYARKKKNVKFRVAVVPFLRQDRETTTLGAELAQQLGAGIAAALPDVALLTNAELESALDREGLHPSVLNDEYVARWFGKRAKIDCVIAGMFNPKSEELEMAISSVPAREEEMILRRTAIYTGGEAVKRRLAQDQVLKSSNGIPRAGLGGVSNPSCESCPAPKFTEEARRAAFLTGTVVLGLAVTPEGRASQIRILRGLEYGLTLAAIEAVQKWKFQPAKGPDGKPTTAWMSLEVKFRLAYPMVS